MADISSIKSPQLSIRSDKRSNFQAKQPDPLLRTSLPVSTQSSNEEIKRLALELNQLCNDKGVELHPSTSAVTIYKIGLEHFKRSPDKVSLIKSVGLLNSAIVRNPKNVSEIKEKLSTICQHILQTANAQNPAADLIQHASFLKDCIKRFRDKANQALALTKRQKMMDKPSEFGLKHKQEEKTILIKELQEQITVDYKEVAKTLSELCVSVMGQPPCKFAIVGTGSMARKEITPYSDFKYIVLLETQAEYKCCSEYFRWFSVIFCTIILNLQETIIPSLGIAHLNDKASDLGDWFSDNQTNGISFDSMILRFCNSLPGKTKHTENEPWITKLIKPIDEMLNYLKSESETSQSEYNLKDVLTEICFIYGDQPVFDEFEQGIQRYKQLRAPNQAVRNINKQLKDYLANFASRFSLMYLKTTGKINLKPLFFQASTLFISALGKFYRTHSLSCFDIVNELAVKEKISGNAKRKLLFAVAIACEIRLNVYTMEKSQRDVLQLDKNSGNGFLEILQIIDQDSLMSYFHITYSLQRSVSALLKINHSDKYSIPRYFNIVLCHALRRNGLLLSLLSNYEILEFFSDSTTFDFSTPELKQSRVYEVRLDDCLAMLENQIVSASSSLSQPDPMFLSKLLTVLSGDLFNNGKPVEALELSIITGHVMWGGQKQARVNKQQLERYIVLLLNNGRLCFSLANTNVVPKHMAQAAEQLLYKAHCLNCAFNAI